MGMLVLPGRDPILRLSPLALLRQSLAWAALAAFLGIAVGLAATFSSSSWAVWAGRSGGLLAAHSLFGVASLLGRGSRAAQVGPLSSLPERACPRHRSRLADAPAGLGAYAAGVA